MTPFTVASFNLKNLIGPDQAYCKFQPYKPEEPIGRALGSGHIGEMAYFSVLNDHLTDGSHPEAPYNKLASDHGQIMATLHLKGETT